jgi:hypothetical protein
MPFAAWRDGEGERGVVAGVGAKQHAHRAQIEI